MTRAAFFITLAVAAAAAAQQPPALPLPSDAAPKDSKKKEKAKPPAALPLPGAATPSLPLPGAAAPALSLPLPGAEAAKPPAASAQKAAPAVETKAVTAQKVTPAVDRSAMPLKNAPAADRTAAAERPAAGAPLSSNMLQLPGDSRLRPDFSRNLWNVRALVGAERSTEQAYTDAVSHSRLGVEAIRWFSGEWIARGELDWRTSRQPYVPLHAAGTTQREVMVDENRFDVAAGIGYDFGPRLAQSGRLELTPMIGVHYLGIRNDAFPSDLIGPEIGGRARFALSSAVIAQATLGYTYNLSVAATQNSALKSPVGDFNARAGLALPLSGGYALELDYSGDVLGFQNTYRVAHGAALAFGTSF